MEAAEVHRGAAEALDAVGLERRGRSRWHAVTDELDWFARLDRGPAHSPWSVEFGVHVLAWPEDGVEHLRQDYASHRSGVPESAAQYRWDDHLSYFTAAFDHRYDGPAALPAAERTAAFAFMAADLAGLFASVRHLPTLVEAVGRGRLQGVIHRRLRAAAG